MSGETIEAARGKWDFILRELGVPGELLTNRHSSCPYCGGKDRFRFESNETGSYYCNGCSPGYGLSLVQKLLGCDFGEAARRVDELLGIDTRKDANFTQTDKREQNRRYLRTIYQESRQLTGTDPASAYLYSRGIQPVSGLRCHPSLPFPITGHTRAHYPAMIGLVQDKNGNALTLHCTYLEPDGSGKAPVDKPKMVAPPVTEKISGGGVRLGWDNSTRVVIAEGIESTISGMLTWGIAGLAALNAGMMKSLNMPDGKSEVIVLADNDNHYEGHAGAYTLANRLAKTGCTVAVEVPETPGNDWLDERVGQ